MTQQARRNYIRATSQRKEHKVLHKVREHWEVIGLSVLLMMAGGAAVTETGAHASVNTDHATTSKQAGSQSNQTEAIASDLHARLMNNANQKPQPQSSAVKNGQSSASSQAPSSAKSASSSADSISSASGSKSSSNKAVNSSTNTVVPHFGLGAMPSNLTSAQKKQYTFPGGKTSEEQTLTPTRTIIYQNSNGQSVAKSVVQKLAAKRTAQINKDTGQITYGTWQIQGANAWPAVTSPTADDLKNAGEPGYGNPSSAVVPSEQPDSNLSNKTVTVQYLGDETEANENATISRTISYDDATTPSKQVAKPVTQSVTFHRTVTINEDTGNTSYSPWVSDNGTPWTSNYNFPAVTSPSADQLNNNYHEKGYGAPGKAVVPSMKVNPALPIHLQYKVTYPETVKKQMVYKTILRKIKYVIEKNGKYYYYKNGHYVLSNIQRYSDGEYYYGQSDGLYPYMILQPVQYARVAYVNQVTGQVSYDSWNSVAGTGTWSAVNSPDVVGSDYTPANNTVETAQASPNMSDVPVDVSYSDKWAPFYNAEQYTRQIQYVDKDNPNKVLAPSDNENASNLLSGAYDVNTGQQNASWMINGSFRNVKSPDLSREGYDAPTITDVASDDAGYSDNYDHGQGSGVITVEYPEHITKHTVSKTVTRTINYVSDHDTSKHVAPTITQPVTFTQTLSTNAVTGKTTASDWQVKGNKSQWSDVKSPDLSSKGYDTPTATDEPAVTPSQNTKDVNITVKYPDHLKLSTHTRVIRRVINYVDANNPSQQVANPEVQVVVYTQPVVSDGETGQTTDGSWQVQGTNKWSDVKSPDLSNAGYQAPDKQDVGEVTTNSNTQDSTITVKYPEQVSSSTDTKVINRTINYVDASNPDKTIAPSVVQPVTYTRTVSTNDVTGQVTYGSWTPKGSNQWSSQQSPNLTGQGYGTPDKARVNQETTSANTSDTSVNVEYPENANPSTNTETVERTINYVDADNTSQHVAATVTQPVEYARSVSTNAVTGKTSYGPWHAQGNSHWTSVQSPDLSANGYDAPEINSVSDVATNGNTQNSTVTVEYPEHEDLTTAAKTIVRTIHYVDKNNPSQQIATPVVQKVTYTCPIMTNSITGDAVYGKWQPSNTDQWSDAKSPDLSSEGYSDPDTADVSATETNVHTPDANVTVSYPEAIKHSTQSKTINRTISYVDANDPSKSIAQQVVQPVTYTRSVATNKVTGAVQYGNWQPNGNSQWGNQQSPDLSSKGYAQPDKVNVGAANTSASTQNAHVIVAYPEKVDQTTNNRIINRTISYVDANDPSKHVATTVTQPVTYTQTIKTNEVTHSVNKSSWQPKGTSNWSAVDSPNLSAKGYDSPNKASVKEMATAANTPNTNITVEYPEHIDKKTDKNVIERTINYVSANDLTKHIAPTVTQPVVYTRTVSTNAATGKVTYSNWTAQGADEWQTQQSPDLSNKGYAQPNMTSVAKQSVHSNTPNSSVTVKYPDSLNRTTDTKTVMRTISYVDADNPSKHVAKTIEQPVSYTRSVTVDKVTGKVTYGNWQAVNNAKWAKQISPDLSHNGYGAASQVTVDAVNTTSNTPNTNIVIKYSEQIKPSTQTKTVERSISYVSASNPSKHIAPTVTQPITYTRSVSTNEVTGKITYGNWSAKGNDQWNSQTSPNLSAKGYGTPIIPKVDAVNTNVNTPNTNITVRYPDGANTTANEETINRIISYVDANDPSKQVATPVTQKVTYRRTVTKDKVTGHVTYGPWQPDGTSQWGKQQSPNLSGKGYDMPDTPVVNAHTVASDAADAKITVKYPEHITITPKKDVITRKIYYRDATTHKPLSNQPVVQTVVYNGTVKTNAVTGKSTTSWTVNGNNGWHRVASPVFNQLNNVGFKNYQTPNITSVAQQSVKPGDSDQVVNVYYPQKTDQFADTKTVTRTINYLDAQTKRAVAPAKTETVAYVRMAKHNMVTGNTTYGPWSAKGTNAFATVTSPDLSQKDYMQPSMRTVAQAIAPVNASNITVDVYYRKAAPAPQPKPQPAPSPSNASTSASQTPVAPVMPSSNSSTTSVPSTAVAPASASAASSKPSSIASASYSVESSAVPAKHPESEATKPSGESIKPKSIAHKAKSASATVSSHAQPIGHKSSAKASVVSNATTPTRRKRTASIKEHGMIHHAMHYTKQKPVHAELQHTDNKTNSKKLPQTGDTGNSKVMAFVMSMLSILFGFFGVDLRKRKKQND